MKYMSKLMNIEDQIVNLNIPSNKDTKDEPKEGGATYTW